MNIGSRLKEERERLGLTQKALGAIGDFGKTTVIAWERGTAFPNALFLADIAAIGADVRYIITGERDAPPPEVLSADERYLLDRYRGSPPPLRDAALRVLLGGDAPSGMKKSNTIIHGKVGNKMRDNTGELTINMGDKKK